jgi:DNA-binding response OmpR family regulator
MARILIVDDDPDVVEVAKVLLEKEGHEIASAGTRTDGLDQVEAFGPDLLVLDVMMDEPDDGLYMAQELRRKGFDRPILMISGISRITGMDFDRDDEMVPVNAFMEKPLEPDAFLKHVKALLSE